MDHQALSREVDRNYDYFQRVLAQHIDTRRGQYALIRDRHIQGFFDDPGAADKEGHRLYSDGIYSIQEVTDEPIDLGLYSCASH